VQARLVLQVDGYHGLQQPCLALQACLVSSEGGQGGCQLLHLALVLTHLLLQWVEEEGQGGACCGAAVSAKQLVWWLDGMGLAA
jgi:hypothetical protein